MKTERIESTLKVGRREYSFTYPQKNPLYDFAVFRGPAGAMTTFRGPSFDEIPTRKWLGEVLAKHFGLLKGDPVLAWLEACFICAREHRVSMRIKRDIFQAAREYRKERKG